MDNIELIIRNGQTIYNPCVEEGITWETERKNSPGKLTFNIMADGILKIEEGNPVRLKVNDNSIFYGFLFSRTMNKDNTIKIVAYDQLRYLKNKDTIVYTNKTASDFIKMLAEDFNLNLGLIEDTKYVLESRVEDNSELFSMVDIALTLTTQYEKKIYVLYDDFGKLTLKNIESMKLPLLYDKDTMEDYNYSSSIDNNTYNQVKLSFDNKDTGKRDIYMAKDSSNINKWGVLQYYDKLNVESLGQSKADGLLALYNKPAKSLSIKNVLGDLRVRAGTSILVKLDLDETDKIRYMVVEKAKHVFKDNEHLMDLTLRGGAFNV
ncbi:hypothetical protein CLPUN_03040 [Clostridium puniceum]|uniref:YqbQ/XkdQ domain-containing protein n=1 Tax=Clostridium puniceum TaxID=29367 RepID=A0A1S8TY46_9CLOT|nr:hydrolase [Clostridium puniceum]OOM82335.1 hypothetical protein CLPUN_03040 [Clostridium puniceum]